VIAVSAVVVVAAGSVMMGRQQMLKRFLCEEDREELGEHLNESINHQSLIDQSSIDNRSIISQ